MAVRHHDTEGRSEARRFEVSHPDKVFFPSSGETKGALVAYYERIANVMLPHIRHRPATLERFPDGIERAGFFQKNTPSYFPGWIRRERLAKANDGAVAYVVIDSRDALAYLANQGTITVHTGLSRVGAIERPDRLIFDLDPPNRDFAPVCWAAREVRNLLRDLGLASFVQTTGSRGVHVVVPLKPEMAFDEVRGFARRAAALLAHRYDDRLTVEVRKAKRRSRILIDYFRNAYGQTAVAPYSVRAIEDAPVATPLDWPELSRPGGARRFTVSNIFRRLGQRDDPWAGIEASASTLDSALASLADMEQEDRRG